LVNAGRTAVRSSLIQWLEAKLEKPIVFATMKLSDQTLRQFVYVFMDRDMGVPGSD